MNLAGPLHQSHAVPRRQGDERHPPRRGPALAARSRRHSVPPRSVTATARSGRRCSSRRSCSSAPSARRPTSSRRRCSRSTTTATRSRCAPRARRAPRAPTSSIPSGAREPVTRWYYLGPMFRAERPQRGRYRQFYQAGCEVFGDPGPACDAEMIDMLYRFFGALGIGGVEVLVNSLGGQGHARTLPRACCTRTFRRTPPSSARTRSKRLDDNPLRILDSKNPRDQELASSAPPILDILDEADRAHWDEPLPSPRRARRALPRRPAARPRARLLHAHALRAAIVGRVARRAERARRRWPLRRHDRRARRAQRAGDRLRDRARARAARHGRARRSEGALRASSRRSASAPFPAASCSRGSSATAGSGPRSTAAAAR